MSVEAVQAFRARVASNPELQKACTQALRSGNIQSIIDAGAVHGHNFTAADLQQCMDAGELSDQELELVAGGGNKGGIFPEGTTPPRNMTS